MAGIESSFELPIFRHASKPSKRQVSASETRWKPARGASKFNCSTPTEIRSSYSNLLDNAPIDHLAGILADFKAKRWTTDPFERFVHLRRENPKVAAELVARAFDDLPKGSTVVDFALSYVSEAEFADLIGTALSRLAAGSAKDVAENVIAYASLQFPHLLHKHLDQVFELAPNEGYYFENWPWHEAPDHEIAFLASKVSAGSPRAFKAWSCMLEMRSQSSLETAARLSSLVDLRYPLENYFEHVGFKSPDSALFTSPVMHVIFPTDYFESDKPNWNGPGEHPTWQTWSEVTTTRFGGDTDTICGWCRQRAHHLMTLPSTVSPLRKDLSVVACLSCLGWEKDILFYEHGANPPRSLDESPEPCTPQFPTGSLKETSVSISLTPPRWRWQDWALSNSRENLHRIFGYPCWVQSAEYPPCPKCNVIMSFLMQYDSDLPMADGGEWLWGSGGICYVFLCRACEVTALKWQCT